MIKIMVGQIVPLIVKVKDGNESLEIKAELKSSDGDLLSVVDLKSVGKGIYQNLDFKMPEVEYLYADYFNDEPKIYEQGLEVFQAVKKPDPPQKLLLGEVVGVKELIQIDGALIGEVVHVTQAM